MVAGVLWNETRIDRGGHVPLSVGGRWIEVISGGFSILGSRGELSVRTEGDNPLLGSAEGVVIVGS